MLLSLARREALTHLCLSSAPIKIAHLGGETIFREMGTFHFDGRPPSLNTDCLLGVMAVDETQLPEGAVALLGLPDIQTLKLSVDYVIAHPGCDWRSTLPSSFWDSCLRFFRLKRRPAAQHLVSTPVALSLLERVPTQPSPPVPAIHDPPGSTSSPNKAPPGRELIEETKRVQREAQDQRARERIGRLFLPVRKHADPRFLEEIKAK